jgi:hypothetical protein
VVCLRLFPLADLKGAAALALAGLLRHFWRDAFAGGEVGLGLRCRSAGEPPLSNEGFLGETSLESSAFFFQTM